VLRTERIAKAASPGLWRDLAIEAWWRARPDASPAVKPTWPLAADELDGVRVRWPAEPGWPLATTWLDPVVRGLARWVKVDHHPIPQPESRVAVTELVVDGRAHRLAIDYSDFMPIDERLADECSLYFKMQYQAEGYGRDNVLPGGYIGRDVYPFLGRLRALRAREAFRFDVYGRFGVNDAKPLRRRGVELLREQTRFAYEGGDRIVRYSRSLREAAQARVCVDLPGRGDLCFRLVDYLAVGACVVAAPQRTRLHVPLVDGEHVAFARPDLSDLVQLCAFYLAGEDARERLGRGAASFFDRYLHRDQLTAYYLRTALDRLRDGVPVGSRAA
jgi:hypothetical protein